MAEKNWKKMFSSATEDIVALEDRLRCDKCRSFLCAVDNDEADMVVPSCRHKICKACFNLGWSDGRCPVSACGKPSKRGDVQPDIFSQELVKGLRSLKIILGIESGGEDIIRLDDGEHDVDVDLDSDIVKRVLNAEVATPLVVVEEEEQPSLTKRAQSSVEKEHDAVKTPVKKTEEQPSLTKRAKSSNKKVLKSPIKKTEEQLSSSTRRGKMPAKEAEEKAPSRKRKRTVMKDPPILDETRESKENENFIPPTAPPVKKAASRKKGPGKLKDVSNTSASKKHTKTGPLKSPPGKVRKVDPSNVKLNKKNKKGETPLHEACCKVLRY